MIILASKETRKQIQQELDYWKDSPSAQRMFRRRRYVTIIPVKNKFLPFAGLALGIAVFANRAHFIHHKPSILLHELRHTDEIKYMALSLAALGLISQSIFQTTKFSIQTGSIPLQIGIAALNYFLASKTLSTHYDLAESDTRSFVARCLMEREAATNKDEVNPNIYNIINPQMHDTSVVKEQTNELIKRFAFKTLSAHQEILKEASQDLRKAWHQSADSQSYNVMAFFIKLSAISYPFMKSGLPTYLTILITVSLVRDLTEKNKNLAKPFNWLAEKVGKHTIPEFDPE